MTRLSRQEKEQIGWVGRSTPQPRQPRRSPEKFVSFATFASRFAPAKQFMPIVAGHDWKL